MSTQINSHAASTREQARQNDGKFGQQSYTRAEAVDLDGQRTTSGNYAFEAAYQKKVREARGLYSRYEAASIEVNEMAIHKVSMFADENAPEDTVAVGIVALYDEPERLEDSLRGVAWIQKDGSVTSLDEYDTEEEFFEIWADVDRDHLRANTQDGLIERGDCRDLDSGELARNDVEYVIPIRGRDHGLTEPHTWQERRDVSGG